MAKYFMTPTSILMKVVPAGKFPAAGGLYKAAVTRDSYYRPLHPEIFPLPAGPGTKSRLFLAGYGGLPEGENRPQVF